MTSTGRLVRPVLSFCYTYLYYFLMNDQLHALDVRLIHFFRRISIPTARWGLFIVFFWFGLLKLLGMSPAAELVENLFYRTMPGMSFDVFYACFAILEMLIGLLFLIPKAERVVIPLLFIHMVTTFMPLFLLPELSWQALFVPTLVGQYIIKNVVIIASAIAIAAHLHPLPATHNK